MTTITTSTGPAVRLSVAGRGDRATLEAALYGGWTIEAYTADAGAGTFTATLAGDGWAASRVAYQMGRLESFWWGVRVIDTDTAGR